MGQGSRKTKHRWTLAPVALGEEATVPFLLWPCLLHKYRTSPTFYTLGCLGMPWKKNSPPIRERQRVQGETLEVGVLGPEFYVVPTELVVRP